MNGLDNSDFHACMSLQPRKSCPQSSKAARELATELLDLVKEDRNKAIGIIKEIMYYSPNKSVEWYYEQAVGKLRGKAYCLSAQSE